MSFELHNYNYKGVNINVIELPYAKGFTLSTNAGLGITISTYQNQIENFTLAKKIIEEIIDKIYE